MGHCVKCKKTGSWVKKYSIHQNSIRRLRVCKDCLTPFDTVEVTLPEHFPKEVTGILEKTVELPTVVPDAGPTLDILDKTLALSMMAGNASAILGRLAAIVDQFPLPVINVDPNPVKTVTITLRSGDDSDPAAAAKESPASVSGKSNHVTSRRKAESDFREAFNKLTQDGRDSVSVADLAKYLGFHERSVFRRVSKMKDEFTVRHQRVYRVADETKKEDRGN